MKWILKLVGEKTPGEQLEHEIATIERTDQVNPASVDLTIAEGKHIMARLQEEMGAAQIHQHGASIQSCPHCGRAFRTKGYYRSILRSVYGNVRMRSAGSVDVPVWDHRHGVFRHCSQVKIILHRNCAI